MTESFDKETYNGSSIEDNDSNVINLKSEKTKSKTKKSLKNIKVGNTEKVVEETITNIIKLLRGLGNISGTNSPDDDELDRPPDASENNRKRVGGGINGTDCHHYQVVVKYEDDSKESTSTVTLENYDSPEQKLIDVQPTQSQKKNMDKEKFVSKQPPNKQNYSSVRKIPNYRETKRNESIKRNNNYPSKEMTEMIKYYRHNGGNMSKTNDPLTKKEEKLYSDQLNNIYKEPSLSFFLPIEQHHRHQVRDSSFWGSRGPSTVSKFETTIPENFGAPYFRFDGTLLDNDSVYRPTPSNDIHKLKFVKSVGKRGLKPVDSRNDSRQTLLLQKSKP